MMAKPGLTIAAIAGAAALAGVIGWQIVSDDGGADPNDPAQVALGKSIYADNCAACHGEDLEGEPDWRRFKDDGTLPAPPHDDSGHTWHHDDGLLFNYTKKGGAAVIPGDFKSGMPGHGDSLTDAEIWAVLAFIKSRWSPRNRSIQNQRNKR